MKNKFIIFNFLLLLFSLLTSCNNSTPSISESESLFESETSSEPEKESETNEQSESESENNSDSENNTPTSISVPNITIENNVVSWTEVDNAEVYEYSINGREGVLTEDNYVTISNGENISVRSINKTYSLYSDYSKAVSYFENLNKDYVYKNVTVYFHNSDIKPIQIEAGSTIESAPKAAKPHYIFENWYKDPFYSELFDFSLPIYENTIVYAKWIPEPYMDTCFWVKANDLVLSEDKYERGLNEFDYIPLKFKEGSNPKLFTTVVTVSGASTSSPAYFLITDGLDGTGYRNYWKCNNKDFAITVDGTYLITFSTETQFKVDGYVTNAKYELISTPSSAPKYASNDKIIVEVDELHNMASWNHIPSATGYEYVINNAEIINVSSTTRTVKLEDGEHISVRAKYEVGYSFWSSPVANYIYEVGETSPYVYAYFVGSNISSVKLNKGDSVSADNITIHSPEGYDFVGWYLDIGLTKSASFPYVLNENTVFYPKFDATADSTKVYYYLKNSKGETVCNFTWNLDRYDYDEFVSEVVTLIAEEQYFITNLDGSKKWENLYVHSTDSYRIYFSEDNVWGVDTEKARHFYITSLSINIYFSAPTDWSNCKYYTWNSDGYKESWPGEDAEYVKTNGYGQKQYHVYINVEIYTFIIFNDGNGKQTCDIPLDGVKNNTGFYIDGSSYGTFDFQ